MARAEVPGYTEKELNIMCEPWRLTIRGKIKEEGKFEKKEERPINVERRISTRPSKSQ